MGGKIADTFEFLGAGSCAIHVQREISDFLESQDTAHPFQFPQWSDKAGYLAIYRQRGKIRWFSHCGSYYPAGRLLRPIRILTVNRGPVSDDIRVLEAGLHELLHAAEERGFTSVEITPDWIGAFADQASSLLTSKRWQTNEASRMTLRLNLRPSLEEISQDFRKVTRYEIRRAERFPLKVEFATAESVCQEWLRLYQQMTEIKHFASERPSHMLRVIRWLISEPRYGGLLVAVTEQKIVGGIVIVRCGTRCWYVFGATAKNEDFSAGHLLQWHALQWAKNNGCSEYDFGGYTPGSKSGPAFFKSGFSHNVVKFPPTHRFVLRPMRLRSIKLIDCVRRRLN